MGEAFPRASTAHCRAGIWMAFVAGLIAVFSASALAAAELPPLTGRVVDNAGIIDASTEASLTERLEAFERKSSDQIVVATGPSLQGLSVEDYANGLFRFWKLGQAKTNNGVLLLVAPAERKVRIEVGYGLEGALTDALSKVIITTAKSPRPSSAGSCGAWP